MSLQALREQRDAKATEIRALHGKSDWNAATDQPAFDALQVEIESIDQRISNHNEMNRLAAENATVDQIVDDAQRVGKDKKSAASAIFAKWLRGGKDSLSAEELSAYRASISNTMSTTTGSEGGFTVQTEVAQNVIDALKEFGGMREVATVMSTGSGNTIEYPTSDGTSEEGEWVAENARATKQDIDFGTIPLNVHKLGSKVVTVPIELLQDSQVDIEAFVRMRITSRLGRASNRGFTTGSGAGQSHGFVTEAAVGKASTLVAAVSYDDLVDLEHSVDPAYRRANGCCFMMNDASLKGIKKIKDADGRPIFLPAYDVSSNGKIGELLGYTVHTNQEMAAPAANAKTIGFGDFSHYMIRDVLDMQMHRFTDSAYAEFGQVGFLTFMRTGGRLVDVGGAVKVLQQAAA